MTSRVFGGILLIASTSIGVGMLALPIVMGFSGFIPSFFLFIFCWALSLFTAFLLAKTTLAFEGEVNFITMAQKTLGTPGKVLCWISYLFLFYSLVAAHIAAFSPLLIEGFSKIFGVTLPLWFAPLPFLFLFGVFVFFGTIAIDWINRLFMVGLISAYLGLIFFLPQEVQEKFLSHIDLKPLLVSLPILVTSFGFHNIIPSLATYLQRDEKKLQKVLFFGSLIPLCVYILWCFLVLGSLPVENLALAWKKGDSAVVPITEILKNSKITSFSNSFALFAILASFLGVTLGLFDFLADGLKIKKTFQGKILINFLMFVPPLLFVYIYPKAFFLALQHAGTFVVILLYFLPALMIWKLPKKNFFNQKILGKIFLSLIILYALFIISLDVLSELGFFQFFLSKYF